MFRPPTAAQLGAEDPRLLRFVPDRPALTAALKAIVEEVARREGRAPPADGEVFHLDGARYPDLRERYQLALAAAGGDETNPPLKVQVGDFVKLRETRCLVESVDARTNCIMVAHREPRGSWHVPIDGTGIPPDRSPLTHEEREWRAEVLTEAGLPVTEPAAPEAPPPPAPPGEPVNPELDAALVETPDDGHLWVRYHRWLMERDDPRGVLMRETFTATPLRWTNEGSGLTSRLLRTHWTRWMGDTKPGEVGTSWHRGFVESVSTSLPLDDAALSQLLGRRSMHFLSSLSLGGPVDGGLDCLGGLPLLRTLDLSQPTVRGIAGLARRRPSSLRELSLGSTKAEPHLSEALAAIPWFAELAKLSLHSLTGSDAAQFVRLKDRFAPLGDHLNISLLEQAADDHRRTLREALPLARLSISLGDNRRVRTTWVNDRPQRAPANFKSRPPLEKVSSKEFCSEGCCYARTYLGSGIPFADADKQHYLHAPLRRCGACLGSNTLVIYLEKSSSYSRRECETTWDTTVEYLCRECRAFSGYRDIWDS